jgi:ABC-type nitrate/sulfonate/bicarbonate transport system substrate-binding protein
MDVLLRTWLRKNGLGPSDVRIVEMPQPKMSPGLQSKSLDGVVVLEPFRTQILTSKNGVKASDYTADIADDVLFGFMMGTRAFVEAHPDAIRALNACWKEAQDFMIANPDETREIERRHYHFAENNPPQLGRTVSPADFRFYADLMQAQGLLRKPVDPSKLVFK